MIVVRAPFRVSFLGGGSDIPRHYRKHGGAVLSTAINRHMFISGREMFDPSTTLLKYARTESVQEISEIQHPIFREALQLFGVSGVDLSVSSDIPAGTGLGSSSTFTVALVKLLSQMSEQPLGRAGIADLACKIEIDLLSEPIGKQDQFASTFGGLNLIRFETTGAVSVHPVSLSAADLEWLSSTMWLVKLPGDARSASAVLQEAAGFIEQDPAAERAISDLAELALDGYRMIQTSGISVLPELVRKAWDLKKLSSPDSHMGVASDLVERGLKSGASAAKLLGAGGGGFVLFFVEKANQTGFLDAFRGERVLHVKPDLAGVTTIYEEDNK